MHDLCCTEIYSFSRLFFILHKKMLALSEAISVSVDNHVVSLLESVYPLVGIRLTDLHMFNKAYMWTEAHLVMKRTMSLLCC